MWSIDEVVETDLYQSEVLSPQWLKCLPGSFGFILRGGLAWCAWKVGESLLILLVGVLTSSLRN